MLKVAIMLERFSVGGAQRVVSELVKNLDQAQLEVRVICCESRADTELARTVENLAQVEYLNISGRNIVKNFAKAFHSLNRFQPDIVHAHLTAQLYAVPWGIIHRRPVIITAHTKPKQAFVKKIEAMIRWALKHGRLHIVAVSQENQQLMKAYFGIDDCRCGCINNGVAVHDFYTTPHEDFTFINVARQDENKNQAAIVRCFAQLHQEEPGIKLILLGDGPCHERLAELGKELGIAQAVDLPGAVSNVADYYAIADAYIQSSHREAMPMSALEAMAAGLPIISTDVGGMRDIVRDNGYLVADDDEEALYTRMRQLAMMPRQDLRKFGVASKRIVEAYSALSMAQAYTALYEAWSKSK